FILYGYIRDLHSFPTRRSSDLESTEVETVVLDVDSAPARTWHVPAFLSMMSRESMSRRKPLIAGAVAVAVILSVAAIGVPAGWRSEEHTSELQSRFELVCRLLL